MKSLGQNIPHDSAAGHVSGKSTFIDDMPSLKGELLVDFVGSPIAHGIIRSIDVEQARNVPGIAAILTAADVPGHNLFGPVVKDEHVFAHDLVQHIGDPIVAIAGESRRAIARARKLIRIECDPRDPIFSIDEAIARDSFLGPRRTIQCGDADVAIRSAPHRLEGTLDIGGQEHFYLESQAAIAVPGEFGQMVIHSSTQHPSEVQAVVAEVLGVPFNHVTVLCKRMGGAFGGKETQAALPAAMVALVAARTNRPARIVYNKDDDMRFTGKRHPFKANYRVGFDANGRLLGVAMDLFSDGGAFVDLSFAVIERAMLHTDNAYFMPNATITGRVCKTNLPSNTAFRGFGGPQGVAVIENILESIAQYLHLDALDVRRVNLYGIQDRNSTPYGQVVHNNVLPEVFDSLETSSQYRARRTSVDLFNSTSQTHLRGMAITAVKFGISFTKQHLNQANALVNIYVDGTVMVSTGATEMGQGVHTRVRQIVADELGIDYDRVIVATTSTDKNNNTSPTAASSGTDLNGAAAKDACARLKQRLVDFVGPKLKPGAIHFEDSVVFSEGDPLERIAFRDLIGQAYLARINLGERGFYATPGVDFDRESGTGNPFLYFTNGAAASEVLIDRFTGEMKVTRVDLLMDAGIPINPGIDRGQITGGFIQGMGWVTNEELRYDNKGALLSHSPTTYKIPNIADLPEVFNIQIMENPNSDVSLYRSKALGEPPLLLGISVWAAAKNALSYISDKPVSLSIPATGERILMTLTTLQGSKTTLPNEPASITAT